MEGCEEEELKFKRQRHEVNVQIRREKRQEIFQAARKMPEAAEEQTISIPISASFSCRAKRVIILDPQLANQIREILQESFKEENFSDMVRILQTCDDILQVHWAAIGLRVFLISSKAEYFIKRVIDHQLVPIIIKLTTFDQYPHLKFEAAWILTNLASGDNGQPRVVAQCGGIETIARLVKQKQEKIVQQAVWGLSNLSADNSDFRNSFINLNVVDDIVDIAENCQCKYLKSTCGMALANLARGSPLPVTLKILPGLLFLCKGLRNGYFTDNDVKADVLCVLYYHFTPKKKNVTLLLDTHVIPTILEIGLKGEQRGEGNLIGLVTKVLGNIILGNEAQVKYLISQGLFTLFDKLILTRSEKLRQQVCWMLSNVVATSSALAKKLLLEQDLMDKILQILRNDINESVLIQVHYTIFNFSVADPNMFMDIVNRYDILGLVTDNLLKESSWEKVYLESVIIVVDAYYEIVNTQKRNYQVQMIGNDAKERISDLEGHDDEKLRTIAVRIGRNLEKLGY